MASSPNKRKKFWKKLIFTLLLIPVLLFLVVSVAVAVKKDEIIKKNLDAVNNSFDGKISLAEIHLAPFQNFPYISIELDSIQVFESKDTLETRFLNIDKTYIGFDVLEIVTGDFKIHNIELIDCDVSLTKYEDGTFNYEKAFNTSSEESESNPLSIDLEHISLQNIDIHKKDLVDSSDLQTNIKYADGGFATNPNFTKVHIDTEFELNLTYANDSTFITDKDFKLNTDITYNYNTEIVEIAPSKIKLENGEFELDGSVNLKEDVNLDLNLKGRKPNFDLLIAFGPPEIVPILKQYKNSGNFYFDAKVTGPALHDLPHIEVVFGAENAFVENTQINKKISNLGFKGTFTSGTDNTLETMEMTISKFSAEPGKGLFEAYLNVKNFDQPDVNFNINTDLDLEYVADFLNIPAIEHIAGKVNLAMSFHDIIDLDQPEKSLNKLNQAYKSQIKVTDLELSSPFLPSEVKKLNMDLEINGQKAILNSFNVLIGQSDLTLSGYIDSVSAVVHHLDEPIKSDFYLKSDNLYLKDFAFDDNQESEDNTYEHIKNLEGSIAFDCNAVQLTEFNNLPVGEFTVTDLKAEFVEFGHVIKNFSSKIKIDEKNLELKYLNCSIDQSDFNFDAIVKNYPFWTSPTPTDLSLELGLNSTLLQFNDLLPKNDISSLPREYRSEEFRDLDLNFKSKISFNSSEVKAIEVTLKSFKTRMKLHPVNLNNFYGYVKYTDNFITIKNLNGQIGASNFKIDGNYNFNNSTTNRRENKLNFSSKNIDLDQLFSINSNNNNSSSKNETTTELNLPDMQFNIDVKRFNYEKIVINDFSTKIKTSKKRIINIDTLQMNLADGNLSSSFVIDLSNKNFTKAYPKIKISKVDLSKLLYKFDDFGQDYILSSNLKGNLNSEINGYLLLDKTYSPNLKQSDVHLDLEILNGRLENYEPMMSMTDYFESQKLSSIKFDTLKNHIDFGNNKIKIPSMTIESNLGFFKMFGSQTLPDNIDFYIRVPWNVITKGAKNKLFGTKKLSEKDIAENDKIEKDPLSNTKYVNFRVFGTTEDYSIKLTNPKKTKVLKNLKKPSKKSKSKIKKF